MTRTQVKSKIYSVKIRGLILRDDVKKVIPAHLLVAVEDAYLHHGQALMHFASTLLLVHFTSFDNPYAIGDPADM